MIPLTLAKFFWDTDYSTLDIKKNERTVIFRILNYGALLDWRWLAETYGQKHLSEVLHTKDRTSLREPVRRLANLFFI